MIMRSSEATVSEQLINKEKSRWLDRLARKAVHNHLRQLKEGEIVLREGKIEYYFGQRTRNCNLCVTIDVLDLHFYSDIAFAGSVGAGEAYMHGFWSCSDLTSLVRLLLINRHVINYSTGLIETRVAVAVVTLKLIMISVMICLNTFSIPP